MAAGMSKPGSSGGRVQAVVSLALIIGAAAVGLFGFGPPRPAGADAPADEFSSARALVDLRVIASEPHPAGSAASRRVRDHLSSRLEGLGLEVEWQQWDPRGLGIDLTQESGSVSTRYWREAPADGDHTNVLAKLRGTESACTALFMCHYDAVPGSFGAGDDGAAAAAFLEAIRALRAGPPPKNDLVFLFTDGEELGMLGAERFVDEHALFREVDVVFNFEGRGVGGPAILFQTGPRNGRLVAEYARCAPHPFGSSLGPAVYALLPNDTDFTPSHRAGLPGLNFAFIAGGSAYHRPADRIESLSEASLQHHGTNVLALARHFGNLSPAELESLDSARDATFLTLPGNTFVHYPGRWNAPLALAAALLVLALLFREHRAGRWSWAGLALGSVAAPLGVVLAVLAGTALAWLAAHAAALAPAAAADEVRGNLLSARIGLAALAAWTLGLAAWTSARLGERRAASLAAAGLVLWIVLLAAALLRAEGASYVLAWPAALGALALACSGHDARVVRLAGGALLLAAAAVILPVAALLHSVGSAYPSWLAAAIATLVLSLFALPCLPWLERAARPAPRLAWALPLAAGAALLFAAELVARTGH